MGCRCVERKKIYELYIMKEINKKEHIGIDMSAKFEDV